MSIHVLNYLEIYVRDVKAFAEEEFDMLQVILVIPEFIFIEYSMLLDLQQQWLILCIKSRECGQQGS